MVRSGFEAPLLGQVVLRLLLVEGDALRLVADDAMKPPGKECHPLGQHRLEVSFWREALQHAFAMLFPVLGLLDARDDRGGGADAMSRGVPAYDLFTFFS